MSCIAREMKLIYPFPFLETLIDAAEDVGVKSPCLEEVKSITGLRPSKKHNEALVTLVPRLTWEIAAAGGEFIGPNFAGRV